MNRTLIALLCASIAPAALARQADAPAAPRALETLQPAGHANPAAKPANKPDLYNESADANDLIRSALAKARKENRRVLIQWGFNSCFWCQLMHREFATPTLAKKLMYEYDVVYVEAAKNKANLEVAKGYGAELDKHGYPYLTILDASGKVLANQETGDLEVKGADGKSLIGDAAAHDEAKVLAFLTDHQATYLQADAVVKDALDQAKASGKRVFVHFGAPWCIWCRRLEAWMGQDEVAHLLAKDYVDVKVDQDRMIGAADVGARYGMPAKIGIPWFAILDPVSGKVLSDSMVDGQTIGCPASDSEIQHFMTMLQGSRKTLSDAELGQIKASLAAAAQTYKSAH